MKHAGLPVSMFLNFSKNRFLFHFTVRHSDFYSLLQFYVGGLHKTEVIGMGGLENVVLQVKPMIPGSHTS